MKQAFFQLILLLFCTYAIAQEAPPQTRAEDTGINRDNVAVAGVSVLPVSENCKMIIRRNEHTYRGKVYVYVRDAWLPVGEIAGGNDMPQRAEWKDERLTVSPAGYFETYYLPQEQNMQWVCAMQDALLPQYPPKTVSCVKVNTTDDMRETRVEYVHFWNEAILHRSIWIRCAGMWMPGDSDEIPVRNAKHADELHWFPSDYNPDYERDITPWWDKVLAADDVTALQALLQMGRIVDETKFESRKPTSDMPRLMTVAAWKGAVKCLDYLLQDADLLSPEQAALYRAFAAVAKDDSTALQRYLTRANVNEELYYYDFFEGSATLLSFAVLCRKAACVEVLLQHPNLDLSVHANAEALQHAVSQGDAELLSRLLTMRSANVNLRTTMGWGGYKTLLHTAVGNGHLDCVRVLLAHPDVDLYAKDKDGKTPLELAEKYGHDDIAALLRDAMKNLRVGTIRGF